MPGLARRINVRLPASRRSALDALACAHGRTRAAELRVALDRWLTDARNAAPRLRTETLRYDGDDAQPVSIAVSDEMVAAVEAMAKRNRRTFHAEARAALEHHLRSERVLPSVPAAAQPQLLDEGVAMTG